MTYSLAGRSAVITGASHGLGLAIAQAFLTAGADVFICARDGEALDAARRQLLAAAGPSRIVSAEAGDVSMPADVERIIAGAMRALTKIDVLVNNAGIYGPFGAVESVSWDEWTRAMEINVYGSVLPVRAVLPHMKSRHFGKIIQVSGGGATNPLPRISAYAASKAAIVRFAETIALEVKEFGIDVNALAPGALNTRLMKQLLQADPTLVGEAFHSRMTKIAAEGGTPLETGAALAVFLAAPESDGVTGRLLSAPWDAWEELPTRRAALENTDIYTLRRIVPTDRGETWGQRQR